MTQAELAKRTGIRPNTINLLYHDYAKGIKFAHLEKICKELGCKISDLVVIVPDPPEEEKNH